MTDELTTAPEADQPTETDGTVENEVEKAEEDQKWNEAQLAAIRTYDRTLLVSAAAGAGKTASLTERLIRRLTKKNAKIDQMLIVTFTRAAAAELRERIGAALSAALAKDPTSTHLSEQIVKLSEAKICTIDSFFLDVVRENFSVLGLPPKFRIADGAELTVLKNNVMNDLIEEYYRRGTEYGHFFDHFAEIRSDRNLAKVFHTVYDALSRHPRGIRFLTDNASICDRGAADDYFSTPFGEVTLRETEDLLEAAISTLEDAILESESYPPMKESHAITYREDLQTLRVLLATLRTRSYADTRERILEYAPKSLKQMKRGQGTPTTDLYKNLRSDFTAQVKALKTTHFLLPEGDIRLALKESAEVLRTLARFLTDYDERISKEKLRRAICDFDDIRRFTYTLLVDEDGSPTPLAKAYSERFSEIYIDEYQDVDSVQDLIFASIATEKNRFLVGDIKQSIYGFRGANPSVFAAYREKFPKHGTPEAASASSNAIYMSENYRCDASVIDFTNLVCGKIFSVCTGGLSYRPEDDLIRRKDPNEGRPLAPVEFVCLSNEAKNAHAAAVRKGEDVDPLPPMAEEPEAAYVVSRIRELLESGVRDRDPKIPNDDGKIRKKDIAVLARKTQTLLQIAAELKAAGIPSCLSAEEDFFENPEVLLMLSLLNTVDNPRRDVYLSAVLRSPLYGFTLEELVRVRNSLSHAHPLYDAVEHYAKTCAGTPTANKAKHFLEELATYRAYALSQPVDRLIRLIFTSPRVTVGAGLSPALPERRHLLRLYEYARQFEAGAFRGLSQFVSYIERLIAEKEKLDVAPAESGDAVRLMTIHKSKGLEFPVCFLVNANGKFTLKEAKEPILLDEEVGVATKLSDAGGFARLSPPMRAAVETRKREKAIEEEMRILYVAMTRARERLIVTTRPFGVSSFEKKITPLAVTHTRHNVMKCGSFAEWIAYAIAQDPAKAASCITVTTVESTAVPPTKRERSDGENAVALDEAEVRAWTETFRKRFSARYSYEHLADLPAKLSVSRLYPGLLDEGDEGAEIPKKTKKRTPPPRHPVSDSKTPEEAARKGTATHCFLQFCDFSRAKASGAEAERNYLVEKRFLDSEESKLCRIDELDAFLESDFFSRLCKAKQVWREQRFNIFLPADRFSKNAEKRQALKDEPILVQGVIDLFFYDENGKLVLADYKTDRLTQEELENDARLAETMESLHGDQLSYYVLALERLLGRRPDEVLVYATAAGRAVPVNVQEDVLGDEE